MVEAHGIEAAAKPFENHAYFAIFPGDGVDIIPFVTGDKTETPQPTVRARCGGCPKYSISKSVSARTLRAGCWPGGRMT